MARLQATARALSDAFDFVIFDCGFTAAEGLSQIAARDTIVVISAEEAAAEEVELMERDLEAAGYEEIVTVDLRPASKENRFCAA